MPSWSIMVDMDETKQLSTHKKLPLVEQALRLFYSGQATSISKAFEATEGVSRATYYSYHEQHPDEMAALELSVKQQCLQAVSSAEQAYIAESTARSIKLQRRATDVISDLIPEWERIAKGKPTTIKVNGKEKTFYPYARDQLKASELILDVARDGVRAVQQLITVPQATSEPEAATPQPFLSIGRTSGQFQSVEAVAADGTTIRASVEPPEAVVVDAEIVEPSP